MEYYLMRKDEIVTLCDMTPDGQMISWSDRFVNPELAPLESRASEGYLRNWWKNRQVPISQGRIRSMLTENGISDPGDYLLRNLGLSLTDYYWMKPLDSELRWKDVNLFDNDFKSGRMSRFRSAGGYGSDYSGLTPDTSLRGELEKSWCIQRGKRCLIKGNHGQLSTESINEVIATELHRKQGYDNYTPYHLIRIKDKPYDYGCCSRAFTDQNLEFVSAYAVLTSEKDEQDLTKYERLIAICGRHGMDTEQLRRDLEYQIMSDYVLTNIDRHMENIGFLRDAETLKFVRMAPIFDTGKAFSPGFALPCTDRELDIIQVNSFLPTEPELLELVKDSSVLDLSRLLSPDEIYRSYSKDSRMWEGWIDSAVWLYEKKIEMLIG